MVVSLAGCGNQDPKEDAPAKPPAGEADGATRPAAENESESATVISKPTPVAQAPDVQPEPAPEPAPETSSEPPAEAATPATLAELESAIDLTKLPRLDVSHQYDEKPHKLRYLSDTTVALAKEHYSKIFSDGGWEVDPTVYQHNDAAHSTLAVGKDGFLLRATFQKSNLARDGGKVYVELENSGNVDPRRLPRPEKIESASDDRVDFSYVLSSDPNAFILFMTNALQEKGWEPLDDSMKFKHGAMQLTVQTVDLGGGKFAVTFHTEVDG